jgi:Ras-related protein Rab-1A
MGIDYFVKEETVDDKVIRVKIWDTAGQEQYKSLTKNFYRKSNGIIIVFDLTDNDSFQTVSGWFKNAKEFSEENIKMILIGNKFDLTRVVPYEEAKSLAETLNIPYFETSAKENTGITEAIRKLVADVIGGNCNFQNNNSNKVIEIKKVNLIVENKTNCKC